MASEVKDSTNESSFSSGSGNNDSGDFECNICFELAQDPVITLCGHLYCWPCLYRWLRNHSKSHECPVCKALVQEEKLIPLYGRGKNPTDPRTKPIPGFEIPNRPAGQRPETAPPPPPPPYHGVGSFPNISFGLFGGFIPFASASFGSTGLSAGLGGFNFNIPSFGFQGVSNGASSSSAFTDGYGNGVDNSGLMRQQVEADNNLKMLLICIGFAVLYFLLCA